MKSPATAVKTVLEVTGLPSMTLAIFLGLRDDRMIKKWANGGTISPALSQVVQALYRCVLDGRGDEVRSLICNSVTLGGVIESAVGRARR